MANPHKCLLWRQAFNTLPRTARRYALLGISFEERIIMPNQVHGIEVRRIDAPPSEVIEGVDAVMTDVPGLCSGVSTAEFVFPYCCTTLVIVQPVPGMRDGGEL